VNPALAEYLRREYGVKLPELRHAGEEGDDDEGSSLQSFYQSVLDVVDERTRAGQPGWSVKTDIFLGLFSFQKLVMFKDLEANAPAFAGHEMIRQLVTREAPPGTIVMGLPDDVRDLELDRDFPPESTAQVVDADSSQLRAIAAMSKEYPLVLEGPPGTGKSQTITNMIAQALAQGKSVLFVAEKMAALQVVHRRLVSAGLGEFCLELHASKANKRAVSIASEVESAFSLPPVRTLADVETAAAVAAVLHESPGAPLAVLESDAWNAPPAEATALVEAVRKLQRLRHQIDQRFQEAVLDQRHAEDVAYVERKCSGIFGFLAMLDGRFRAIKRRWLAYRKPGHAPPIIEQANDMKLVDQYLDAREALEAKADDARSLFGRLWRGERSDPALLEHYIDWVVKLRGVCVRNGLGSDTLAVATTPAPDVSSVTELKKAVAALRAPLANLRERVEWPSGYLAALPLGEILERVRAMSVSIGGASEWATFEQARRKAAATPAAELVDLAMRNTGGSGDVPFAILAKAFRRALLERWLEEVMTERSALREFRTLTHEEREKEFRRLDERVLEENRAAVVARLREATQQRLQTPAARAGLPFVQREMAKQRRLAPLRKVLQHAEATVRAVKPCFLMSPLTVAQYLDGGEPSFDVVIFDEASQLRSEDAIGSIARGKQLVVVGDPKQLPPTDFFAPVGGAPVPVGDDGLPVVQDGESVLEEYMGAGVPVTRLKWHYRSAHESLITFSNVSFYDADLYTFPSVETGSDASGLSFELVEDGVYEGKGLNMAEARRVVDAVVRHAKERPHESLGVGTFNLRQQLAILDELELRRRQDPSIEPFFARDEAEPFFVKNLENIQGDERDVIFLSVTYAKGADGRLRYNFGPINGENGWRRLNVLTTRARKRMRVFSSMHGDDINAAGTTSRGAHLLRDFLRYAEFGRLDSVVANATAAAESPFEQDVISELTRRGVRVVPQVGAAGYRIDIGVLDDEVPGRFVCGIECDGVAYHSAETARDRDRLRQQVLEARGWTILRVWSTDWFKDRAGQIDRLLKLIAEAKGEAKERIAAEAEAEARARELAEVEQRERDAQRSRVEAESLARVRAAAESGPYVRPTAPAYRFADGEGKYAGADFSEAPTSHVTAAIIGIVEAEGPVHIDDVASRVAAMWGMWRVGRRILAKVQDAVSAAVESGGNRSAIVQRGEFLWPRALTENGEPAPVRSRAGTKISGDRVAPEEIREAIRLVLQAAGGMTRDELLSEVRHVLGVGKTALAPGFDGAIEDMVRDGTVGEGSTGYALRS
jgi:very-short-patch-repair endonuclease